MTNSFCFSASPKSNCISAILEYEFRCVALSSFTFAPAFHIRRSTWIPTEPDVAAIYIKELVKVSDEVVGVEGAEYWLPIRRLALSNIVMLKLAPGRSTPVNRHDGFELLIPLESTLMQVKLGSVQSAPVAAQRQQMAYFPSGVDHEVRNIGAVAATVIVLRIHRPRSNPAVEQVAAKRMGSLPVSRAYQNVAL